MSSEIDPILVEVLHNGLMSVVDEFFVALMKSAYSSNIKERRDHSVALVDITGRLIVQAKGAMPIHLGSMRGLMDTLLAKVPLSAMRSGDIFVANDPFEAGGTHLPDLNMAMPVFVGSELVAFICNIAHHADFGGMTPGSMSGGMTEIYQEGLRVPLVRLFDGGKLVEDIYNLIIINTRVTRERKGDINAQVAACRLGARRFGELFRQYGRALVEPVFDEIIARTDLRMRRAIAALPDGIYEFADVMDDDGCGTKDIAIRVRVEIAGDRISVDFAGSSPQVAGNINCTGNATASSVGYAIKALLDPDAPNNEGALGVIEWTAEEGSVVNATYPAAVANRAHTCQRVVDVMLGALGPAAPLAAVGASNGANTTAIFSGTNPRTRARYIYFETLGGGFGGRSTKDGKDGVQVHITNTSNLPVEAIEMEYPLLVEAYEFVEDSGGAGKHRGGLGLRRIIRPVDGACEFSGCGERMVHQPWGIFGGSPGGRGRFALIDAEGNETVLPAKGGVVSFGPAEAIKIETPGAGGYGPAAERDRADIEDDRRTGKFSAAFLSSHYAERPQLSEAMVAEGRHEMSKPR